MPKVRLHPTLRRAYGWKRGLPQPKDKVFATTFAGPLPGQVDLRPLMPPVYDQGDLGSCTANAFAALGEFLMNKQGIRSYVPSRLFIYYNERAIEGTISEDSGATMYDGATVVESLGLPRESKWWYNTFKFKVKPNKVVYSEGAAHRLQGVSSVIQDLDEFKTVLASNNVFVGGISVFESFECDDVQNTGVVPLTKAGEKLLGGHAITIVGYDDDRSVFIGRNSWGEEWGDHGYFYLPYDYLTCADLADDFWTATSYEGPRPKLKKQLTREEVQ